MKRRQKESIEDREPRLNQLHEEKKLNINSVYLSFPHSRSSVTYNLLGAVAVVGH